MSTPAPRQLALNIRLRADATFANYTGEARQRLQQAGPLVYLWGEPQTGRSHLLQAACHQVPDAIYLTDLQQLSPAVLNGLDNRSLVCLDDIDQVVGDREWQEALFHLINGCKDQGSRLMLAARPAVRELEVSLPDLQSRLLAAVAIETDTLTDQQKLQVLQQRASGRGFALSADVGQFILSRSARDMRSLLVLLERLETESLRQQKKITIPFVKQCLAL